MTLDQRVTYAVRTGDWNEGRAILLDAGEFPRSRLADVARLFRHVHVIGDRGAAAELRRAGVGDVTTQEGSDLGDAIRATSAQGALVVVCAEPTKPRKMLAKALKAITAEDGPQLPVAAIMVMRSHRPADGPVCAIAEHSFVSGYGLLLSVLMADRTHRRLNVTVPRRDEYKATHAEVVSSAMELAHHVGVELDMRTDPLPRSWAIANSDTVHAVFCGVLQAGTSSKKRSSAADDEVATAVELLQRASCDVVVVLDHVSIVHGASVGAQVARLIGAALVAGVAVTGAAAPAVAARPVAAASHVQTPKTRKARGAETGTAQTGTGVAAAAAPAADATVTGAGATGSAATDQGATNAAATDEAGADAAATDEAATDQAATDVAATDAAATDAAATDASATDAAATDASATDAAATDEVETDEPESAAIEMPQEYIAFQVWTDAAGHNHVISTGLQDHPVDTPPIPDWAYQDASQGWAENRAQDGDAATTGSRTAQQPTHKKRAHRKAAKHKKRVHRKATKHKRAHRKATKHKKRAHRKATQHAKP